MQRAREQAVARRHRCAPVLVGTEDLDGAKVVKEKPVLLAVTPWE